MIATRILTKNKHSGKTTTVELLVEHMIGDVAPPFYQVSTTHKHVPYPLIC